MKLYFNKIPKPGLAVSVARILVRSLRLSSLETM
jgi:hypothetical protein